MEKIILKPSIQVNYYFLKILSTKKISKLGNHTKNILI